jgi:hypothetical protein
MVSVYQVEGYFMAVGKVLVYKCIASGPTVNQAVSGNVFGVEG